MLDWAGFVLKALYYSGHLIGLSNFEFNWKTGRVFTTARSTLYAVAVNCIILILLAFQVNRHYNIKVIFGNSNKLHELVIITMASLRITSGLSTVLNRWRQRRQMMDLSRKVLHLFLVNTHVKKMSRSGIMMKFLTGNMTDFIQMAITLNAIGRGDWTFFLEMGFQFWMSSILNLAISQHYLVMLFVRAQYHLLNIELRQVIDESLELSYSPPRKAAFMTRCCHLADQLEDIAKLQSQVQSIVTQLGEVFGIQGLFVYGRYYISWVANIYMTYSLIKNGPEALGITRSTTLLLFAWCFFYYWDALLNIFIILNAQDDHNEMIHILEERTLFASDLDVRLEESFESLQLQLMRNPLIIDVMKIFRINRDTTSAMFGSLISHSIFLIQYDIQFF